MAIRIRIINGVTIALCAARSMPKEGDIYLDDAIHGALSTKFALDLNSMWELDLPFEQSASELIDQEESNNPNRDDWDRTFAVQ